MFCSYFLEIEKTDYAFELALFCVNIGFGGICVRFLRKILLSFLIVAILTSIIGYIYIKNTSPLDAQFSGSSFEKHILLVEIGNKSRLADIWIEDVFVNNGNLPSHVMIQESNPLKGFIISSNFEGDEEKEYNFQHINSVSIQPNTARKKQFDKLINGTASEKDIIYAITISHDESIEKIKIKYRFLGLSFEKTIQSL